MVEFNLTDKVMGKSAMQQLKDLDGMAQLIKVIKRLVEGYNFQTFN